MFILNTVMGIFTTSLLIMLTWASYLEKEWRASGFSFLAAFVSGLFWYGLIYFQESSILRLLNMIVISVFGLVVVISVVKWFPCRSIESFDSIPRYDERDHMFSRNNLQYHPHLARQYYMTHTDKLEPDKSIHILPELFSPGGKFYHELIAPIGIAAESVTMSTREASLLKKAEKSVSNEPQKITEILIQTARFFGAADVGIARLRDYHFYSHAGRQAENWGEPISSEHKYGIVILVPMRVNMIKKAPLLPEIIESTGKYVETAKIAHIIANYIKLLGYDARAHFDAHYEVALVSLAKDAGLGEVGRLGILIHPRYGPCLRLSAVTTSMQLEETPSRNVHIEEFCNFCKKCAENCPSRSIPLDKKPIERGFSHWSIDMESCYGFWKKIGTDCGVCIRVCPFTKPETTVHRMARYYVSRNPLNQRIALFFDNLLYRRKPPLPSSNPNPTEMI